LTSIGGAGRTNGAFDDRNFFATGTYAIIEASEERTMAPVTPEPSSVSDAATPIACVDLNGVLDVYTGWQGAAHFDPPRPGAREFLAALRQRGYRIVIFTTRYDRDVWTWVHEHGLVPLVDDVTDRKPAAHVFVDDRAVCFRGDFEATLRDIDAFSAHWEPAREAVW
jgi:phosphoglycolate phosphatase-like HAD superfamily hydrolase